MTAAQRWTLALASVASLMVVLDMLVVTTALDRIRLDLGASMAELEWTITAFTLSFAVLLLPASALGDRLGRRRMFVSGLAVFTAASVACALAPGTGALIAARAVQGVGAALIMPHAMALLGVAFPGRQRARALGLFSSVTGLGTVGGPVVGGAITQGLDWHWIFWVNVPIGALLIPLARARMAESTGPARRLDFGGLGLVTGGAFGLVWGLVRGNAVGWSSAETVATLCGGAVLAVGFVVWEMRAAAPMLPMRFFRAPAFAGGNASSFLMYATTVGVTFLITQYLQAALGYSPLGTGLRLIPWTLTLVVVGPVAGALVPRVGERTLLVGGLSLVTVAMGWIALLVGPELSYPALIPPLILGSCGISSAMPAAQHAVLGAVAPASVGAASGVFNTLRQLGSTFGVAILSAVFAASGGYGSARTFSDGFRPAMAVGTVLAAGAAIAGWWTPGRRSRHEAPGASPSSETNAETNADTNTESNAESNAVTNVVTSPDANPKSSSEMDPQTSPARSEAKVSAR
ncbi:MAG: MFS transporter [Catenulispora sp.]|nr:MFS transporter [Catenulispora sp.]